MITAEKRTTTYPVPIVGEVVYPDEFMDELEAEIAPLQPYISLEELNLKYGVELNIEYRNRPLTRTLQ